MFWIYCSLQVVYLTLTSINGLLRAGAVRCVHWSVRCVHWFSPLCTLVGEGSPLLTSSSLVALIFEG
jgi:hypothetical protein